MKNMAPTLLIWLLSTTLLLAQDFSEEQLKSANTALNETELSQDEKGVILYMNLARMYPKRFAEVMEEKWLRETSSKYLAEKDIKSRYFTSLKRTLNKMELRRPLMPSKNLYKIAKGHASFSGKTGKTGHGSGSKSFESRAKGIKGMAGENCSYGYSGAFDIVMQLLVDSGVSGVGHRKNILNQTFKYTGVAIAKHKKWEYNCVIDYASDQ